MVDVSPAPDRRRDVSQRLVRMGFSGDADVARALSDPLRLWDADTNGPRDDAAAAVVSALSRAADPDLAVTSLSAMVEAAGSTVLDALRFSPALRAQLIGVLGASRALGEHLAKYPDDWTVLPAEAQPDAALRSRRLHEVIGADAADPITGSAGTPAGLSGREAVVALSREHHRQLLAIAGPDLAGHTSFDETAAALADLATASLSAGLAAAAASRPDPAAAFRLAVIALGKTGGRELNYVSDIDVVFVADATGGGADATGGGAEASGGGAEATDGDDEAALAAATKLAGALMRISRDAFGEVDANLRPEGAQGPLVRTLDSHLAYYRRWASTWEFQALLKARPAAGDPALGEQYLQSVGPLVWQAAERPDFVPDVQAMRRRVVAQLPADVAPREIKLGPGGLRDVEFAVQLLQLVHGRLDETLRAPGTLAALAALRDGGYVGRDDAVSLADAYRFLRATEDRLQLYRLRRTHLLPEDPAPRVVLARALGFRPDQRGDALAVFTSEWQLHVREVRRLHEKLFYRPLLAAVARVPGDELRLSPQDAVRRLAALGFADPRSALSHLDALSAGLSRRAAIQRTLLPVLLADFSAAPDPDAGLLGYRRLSDALGEQPWFLRTLRDEGEVAERLATVLGTSRYLTSLLVSAPASLRVLADDEQLRPRSLAVLQDAMADTAARQNSPEAAVRAVRAVRRTELVRIAAADVLERAELATVQAGLSDTMDATIGAALSTACDELARDAPAPARVAVLAAGRLGGRELGYGSDADVLFVYEPVGEQAAAARYAMSVFGRLRALLSAPSDDPPVQLDADLRPEGRDGPLARTVDSYAAYYRRWAAVWEFQALLRVRPCAGDPELAARLIEVIDAVRYPEGGLDADAVREIRRIKGRVEGERLPRGADPLRDVKLGRGGLSDVEWTVQLLQLQHAHAVPPLRSTSTLAALQAAAQATLLKRGEADELAAAWRLATRVRNAIVLARGRPADQLPAVGSGLVEVGRLLGYPAGFEPGELDDSYRRHARRARRITERVFYGER